MALFERRKHGAGQAERDRNQQRPHQKPAAQCVHRAAEQRKQSLRHDTASLELNCRLPTGWTNIHKAQSACWSSRLASRRPIPIRMVTARSDMSKVWNDGRIAGPPFCSTTRLVAATNLSRYSGGAG